MISIGDALLKLRVDKAEFDKSMQQVTQQMQGFDNSLKKVQTTCNNLGKVMLGMGTAIVGGLVGATIASAKLGDEILEMSQRTGLGTVALSELRYMAQVSGTSLSGLESSVKRMQVTLVDASKGSVAATQSIKGLGLSVEDLMALSPEEQFYEIVEAIANIEDPTIRAATAVDIFGRSGTDLLPMLAGGAAGLAKMRGEAHEYGRIISEEAAVKSNDFMDALVKLKESFGKITDAIATSLMPILIDLMNNKIVPLITKIADWIKAHKELVVTLLKIGAVLAIGGIILVGLANLAKAIIAINAALILLQALAGPAGWAKIAIGIGIAAAAIAGMNKLMSSVTGLETPTVDVSKFPLPGGVMPSGVGNIENPAPWGGQPSLSSNILASLFPLLHFQHGGIVPGAIGQPVPIIAHGGEEYLGVQNIGRSMGNSVTINLGVLPGDDATIRRFFRGLKDFMGEDGRRNAFAQVNKGYYFGKGGT